MTVGSGSGTDQCWLVRPLSLMDSRVLLTEDRRTAAESWLLADLDPDFWRAPGVMNEAVSWSGSMARLRPKAGPSAVS
ncbi:hypothetical protein PBY51_001289 [Eleginops maclovinus]|uniref:Uncharacterized protein n=1 Tax=Eleginops maclovinus TaxID=56733 RepID=A0AAN7ZZT4_ELEMC|nr:hypothetical protein PBY51_001289 [Eleginops maclovinus]